MNSQHTTALPGHDDGGDADHAAPGWDAITHALAALYKGRKPRQFDNPNPWRLGGEDPLDAISAWQRAEPVPHWHYVTSGFSELYAKKNNNPALSGFGFELTFRVAAELHVTEPPVWPMHLLQSLARYVFKSGAGFHEGHRMSTNGPISLGAPTSLCALGFAADPELPAIETPNGRVVFLQVIGLTDDEERAAQQWDLRKLLALLLPVMPLWITDIRRESLLVLPVMLARALEGIRKDGSSSVALYADLLEVSVRKKLLRKPVAEITLGARQIAQLAELLPLRLPFGRPLTMAGPRWKLHFVLAKRNAWRVDGGVLTLSVNAKSVAELTTLLHPRQGVYKLPSFQHILWNVRPTTIRSADGGIVEIIG
jgi:suppressor of fused-like protein